MRQFSIPVCRHSATQMTRADYDRYDYIIGMDRWNYSNILKITGPDDGRKISLLRDFTDTPGDIADPWYTGNFDITYDQIDEGCRCLLEHLIRKGL